MKNNRILRGILGFALVFGFAVCPMALGLVLVSCESDSSGTGDVVVRNNWSDEVTVQLIQTSNGEVLFSANAMSGGTAEFYDLSTDIGLKIKVISGLGTYESASFTLSKGETRRFGFNGSSVI